MVARVGQSMTEVVGDTPVVQLRKVVPEGAADVFVKLEWFNPTGPYKDRMALDTGLKCLSGDLYSV